MTVVYLLFLVVAAVMFALAVFGQRIRTFDLIAAGLFFWVLVPLIQTMQRL